LSRLRREREVVFDPRLLQLNTTHLTVEEEGKMLIQFWLTGEPEGDLFRLGPPPPYTPPGKLIVGLSSRQ
jgi:hypothetical protein